MSETTESNNIPTIDRLPNKPPEIPRNAFVPMIVLRDVNHPERSIPNKIQNEAQRAALSTMQMLGIDISKYRQGITINDLVDVETTNASGELTLLRKPGGDASILVIVLSANPLYDEKGQEVGPYETADNMLYINLHNIDQYITGRIPTEVKVGMAVIEETIHHIQHNYWGRPRKSNIDSIYDVGKHMQDPLESEMHPYRERIGKVLYPNVQLDFRGV